MRHCRAFARLAVVWLLAWLGVACIFCTSPSQPHKTLAVTPVNRATATSCVPGRSVLGIPNGCKLVPIERVCVGDYILGRDQTNPFAPARPLRVEMAFQRTSDHLRLVRLSNGSTIRTTDEHPFWVAG